MTTTDDRDGRPGRGRRVATGLALAGASALGVLALPGAAHASGGSLSNIVLNPGGEACTAAHAETSVTATGSARQPGLKFKLIGQGGSVVTGTGSPGPVTAWGAQTQAGWYNWQGPGDYTACAKNNGTTSVYLNLLSIDTA
ncbi:hypothetical protein AGRA3207_007141 [Actinomadura graeca]|uniref:Uncharacterized protein n=1 Tax=Actinomadura graeca TaxID=2750812 RepID=A0ABX8R3G4_9ACTN|nr:hypothetical protein [Actinomadura graeca]QXJ25621.1 hypothetical protein AGRA3207_007141 [Actinomadura graeca]